MRKIYYVIIIGLSHFLMSSDKDFKPGAIIEVKTVEFKRHNPAVLTSLKRGLGNTVVDDYVNVGDLLNNDETESNRNRNCIFKCMEDIENSDCNLRMFNGNDEFSDPTTPLHDDYSQSRYDDFNMLENDTIDTSYKNAGDFLDDDSPSLEACNGKLTSESEDFEIDGCVTPPQTPNFLEEQQLDYLSRFNIGREYTLVNPVVAQDCKERLQRLIRNNSQEMTISGSKPEGSVFWGDDSLTDSVGKDAIKNKIAVFYNVLRSYNDDSEHYNNVVDRPFVTRDTNLSQVRDKAEGLCGPDWASKELHFKDSDGSKETGGEACSGFYCLRSCFCCDT